jgi:DNA-binding CsgD family transcriptional regulator
LLEREREFGALGDAVRAAAAGRGGIVMVSGPAGIGKTALLDALVRDAVRQGVRPLRASGGELERAFAYGVVRQLFEPVLAASAGAGRLQLLSGAAAHARSIVDPRSADAGAPVADPSVVPHGLYWLTANLATEGPLLLLVDDAHWSDVASLQWLVYLARRIEGLPVCVLVARRPPQDDGPSALLELLAAQDGVSVVSPAPLSEAAVAALARAALGDEVEVGFVRACREATAGNPFYITQLLAALRADDVWGPTADPALVGRLGPQVVASTMLARLATMTSDARTVAQAVAVLEPHGELRHVAELAGIAPSAAASAADSLHQTGLLASVDPCRFSHPLLRAAIEDDLRSTQRSVAHQRAAAVLDRAGAPLDAVAAHLLLAPPTGDVRALETLQRAAREAMASGAAASAVAYLTRALAEPPPPAQLQSVTLELGIAETSARRPEAIPHLQDAVELARGPKQTASAVVALCQAHLFDGNVRAGYEVAREAADRWSSLDQPALELEALLLRVATIGGFVREIADRVRRLASTVEPDSPSACIVIGVGAFHAVLAAQPAPDVRALVDRALPGERLPMKTPALQFGPDVAAVVCVWLGDYERADRLYGPAIEAARSAGSRLSVAAFAASRSVSRLRAGDLGGADADLEDALTVEPEDSHRPHALVAVWARTALLVERGEAVAAERCAAGGLSPLPFASSAMAMLISHATGVAQLARGRFADAARILASAGDGLTSMGAISPAIVPWRSDLALALAGLGDHQRALTLVSDELELAERAQHDRAIGIALRARGLIEGGDSGLILLERAVSVLAPTQSKLEYARARIDYGAALRRANRRTEARDHLRLGVDIAHRCTATALSERGVQELRALGARPRSLALSGVESLTASEARVARMAADGHSNREIAQMLFITLKTVEKHLGNVFIKLTIHSRRELAAALGEER